MKKFDFFGFGLKCLSQSQSNPKLDSNLDQTSQQSKLAPKSFWAS